MAQQLNKSMLGRSKAFGMILLVQRESAVDASYVSWHRHSTRAKDVPLSLKLQR
jgi:hypothetical protein